MPDIRPLIPALTLALLLTACATAPLSMDDADPEYTVDTARNAPADAVGRTVVWAGAIARAENLTNHTLIEVVAYPMDGRSQRPLQDNAPLGRFLARAEGYVETAELPPGRRITVRGQITGFEDGTIGEADYSYPVVATEAVELWPRQPLMRDSGSTRFHFGIGIMFSN